jgi:glutamate 5-kinase
MQGTQWGTGGMATKLTAARIATAAGCKMAITHAAHVERIFKIVKGEKLGTVFHPVQNALRGRRRWILSVPVKARAFDPPNPNHILSLRL